MPDYSLTRLPGGVRVVTERVEGVRSASIGFWIGAGSRDEPPPRAGVTHFIEHLLFKGSERYSAQDIAETFDAMGGELNAATSRETTVVYTRVPDDRVDTAVDAMADMVFRPSFHDVDSEREVVLEEIAMVDDSPGDLVHDLASEAVFRTHPLGRPVIGTAEVIGRVSRRSLQAYHRDAYTGQNIVVAAAGNVDHDAFTALVARRARGVKGPPQLQRRPARAPRPATWRFQRKDTEQYHLCLGGPGISRGDERRYAATLLDAIVGGSASSRLFQEIREKRGLAYSVYTYASQFVDTGQIGLYVGTREENVSECMEIVARELRDVIAGGLRPGELERAKENVKGRLLLSLESTSTRMSRLGKALVTGTEIVSVDDTIARVDAVDENDVVALAGELFATERLSIAGIGTRERVFREGAARINPEALARSA